MSFWSVEEEEEEEEEWQKKYFCRQNPFQSLNGVNDFE